MTDKKLAIRVAEYWGAPFCELSYFVILLRPSAPPKLLIVNIKRILF